MIIAAAIKRKNVVFTGVRHCEIFKDLRRLGIEGPYHQRFYEQGFITDQGKFLNRENAKNHVIESGQRYEPHSFILTSEDLW